MGETSRNNEFKMKITVVGDGAVGKTCFLIGYTEQKFDEKYVPTVFDNYSAEKELDGVVYNLALWDTAGQEDYERLRPLSYPNTTCFLVCFSIANESSLQNVKTKWAPEIKHHMPHAPMILVGLKSDLRNADDPNLLLVTTKDANKLRKLIKAEAYFECSAKTLTGLNEVIEAAMRVSLKKRVKKQRNNDCSIL